MVCVRPGVLLVFAILVPTSELIRLDFPTLERPTKAISGALGGGNCRGSAAEVTKRVKTFMPYYRRSAAKVQANVVSEKKWSRPHPGRKSASRYGGVWL